MATDESATDAELLKLANRDAAALLRSPFIKKDESTVNLPTPVHVSAKAFAGSLSIGQVSVMQTVRNARSNAVGTVHAVDKNKRILVRWDGDKSLSEAALTDLTLVGLPTTTASAAPAAPIPPVSAAPTNVNTEIDRCYNQSCGKTYEGAEQKCNDCNFPRDRTSYFGKCGHLTDPAKKWCQHPNCSGVNTHFLPIEHQAQLQAFNSSTPNYDTNHDSKSKLFKDRHPSLRTKLPFVDADLRVFLLLRAAQSESDLKYSRTMPAPDYLCTLTSLIQRLAPCNEKLITSTSSK